jgi:S-formylglutathione hydrolase FrmB
MVLLIAAAACVHADDAARLAALFEAGAGGTVTVPPGDYRLDGTQSLALRSGTTVTAYGARFHFPQELGDRARRVMFAGKNVSDFRWFGGRFVGRVFDPDAGTNTWAPSANTRAILIETGAGGRTENLTFRDITADGVAGAVVSVFGCRTNGVVATAARNVTVENCALERSGKFMWDYGYLWQITVWPEEHTERERELAAVYFRNDLIRGPVGMADGGDRVTFANAPALPVSARDAEGDVAGKGHHRGFRDTVCFFGDALPKNVTRGKEYFVVASDADGIRISERRDGPPIRFKGAAGPGAKLIHNFYAAHYELYYPVGSGPGKGAVDLMYCENAAVRGCRLSALGDAMHIAESSHVVFAGNHITGARMGAFFLAHFCKDAVITGNTVEGSNGSRVLSVEKSCEDVVIAGNTFRNGGRGSWINQPRNLILADNVFVNNTTKCEPDFRRGRRSLLTGDWERYAEVYFARYEPDGRYGNIQIRGNVFVSGDHAAHAMTFAPGGYGISVTDNRFDGRARDIVVAAGCEAVAARGNAGLAGTDTVSSFHSRALGRDVPYSVFLPGGEPPAGGWPLIVLLHGRGRGHRTILDDGACRDAVLSRRLAVVCADGRDGWYVDSPADPASRDQSMLRELLALARRALPVSTEPRRTGVFGWSMGGYGAVRFAEDFPGEIGAVAAGIALLDFPTPADRGGFGIPAVFGTDEQAWLRLNCMTGVERLRGKRVFIAAAKAAFDYPMNTRFRERLEAAGIAHDYRVLEGGHTFDTVRETLPMALDFLEGALK